MWFRLTCPAVNMSLLLSLVVLSRMSWQIVLMCGFCGQDGGSPADLLIALVYPGKNGDLLPTTEEAEELERALQAVTSLECLSTIGVLTQSDGVPVQELSDRGIGVFSTGTGASGIPSLSREVNTDLGELLNGRIVHDNFSSLELDESLLRSATLSNPPTPLAGQIQGQFSAPASVGLTSATLMSQSALGERAFPGQFHGLHDGSHASQRPHPAQLLSKADDLITSRQQYSSDHSHSSPHGSHYDSEHVPSPYSDHITSPHTTSYSGDNMAATFSAEMPVMAQHLLPTPLEVPLGGVVNPKTHWGNLPVNLGDPSPFSNLLVADGHLLSTSLSTPPTTSNSETTQPAFATVTPSSSSVLPGLPQTSFSGMGPSAELLASTSPKQQLPQFSAAFGHQLSSHSGIPKDLQPSHSSIAPPTGFTVTGATATSTNNASSPFTSPNWACLCVCRQVGNLVFSIFFSLLSPTPSPPFPKEDFKNNRRGLEENSPFPVKQVPPAVDLASVFTCAPWHWCSFPPGGSTLPPMVSLAAQHSDWIESTFSSKS